MSEKVLSMYQVPQQRGFQAEAREISRVIWRMGFMAQGIWEHLVGLGRKLRWFGCCVGFADGYTPSEIAKQLRLRTTDVRRVLVTRWIELFT